MWMRSSADPVVAAHCCRHLCTRWAVLTAPFLYPHGE
jgi:hypothetical protein